MGFLGRREKVRLLFDSASPFSATSPATVRELSRINNPFLPTSARRADTHPPIANSSVGLPSLHGRARVAADARWAQPIACDSMNAVTLALQPATAQQAPPLSTHREQEATHKHASTTTRQGARVTSHPPGYIRGAEGNTKRWPRRCCNSPFLVGVCALFDRVRVRRKINGQGHVFFIPPAPSKLRPPFLIFDDPPSCTPQRLHR